MSNRFLSNALNAGLADEAQQKAAASWITRLSNAIENREARIRQLESEVARYREAELKQMEQPDKPVHSKSSKYKTTHSILNKIYNSFNFWNNSHDV